MEKIPKDSTAIDAHRACTETACRQLISTIDTEVRTVDSQIDYDQQ